MLVALREKMMEKLRPYGLGRTQFEMFLETHYEYEEYSRKIEDIKSKLKNYGSEENFKTKKLKKEQERLEKKQYDVGLKKFALEKGFVAPHKGLYIGIGVDLDTLDNAQLSYIPWGNLHNHFIVFGTTRFGKSRFLSYLADQYIAKGDNLILIDPKAGPKNEMLGWALESAMEANRLEDVAYVNPFYLEITDYLNPIYGMGDEEIASLVWLLLQGAGGSGSKSSDEAFFEGFTDKNILAIMSSLSYLEKAIDPKGDLVNRKLKEEITKMHLIYSMRGKDLRYYDEDNNIVMPDVSERMSAKLNIDAIENTFSEFSLPFNRTFVTFKDIANYVSYDRMKVLYNAVKTTPIPDKAILGELAYSKLYEKREEALRLMAQSTSKSKDYFDKVAEGYEGLLTRLSSGTVGKVFCTLRINPFLNRLYSDRGLIAVIQPNPMKSSKTSELIVKIITRMFESIFGLVSATGRSHMNRTTFLIDEGEAALNPGIHSLFNKAGGLGMTIGIFTQSLADIEYKLGPVGARIVADSINTKFYMKSNDGDSKMFISGDIGTIKTYNTMYMGSDIGPSRGSVIVEDVQIAPPEALNKLQKGEAYMTSYGQRMKVCFPFKPDAEAIEMPKHEFEAMIDEANAYESKISKIQEGMADLVT